MRSGSRSKSSLTRSVCLDATCVRTRTRTCFSCRFEVEREYVASVDVPPEGEEPGDSLVAALNEGITTADGVYRADVPAIDGRDVRVVVREGKNRMVRRSEWLLSGPEKRAVCCFAVFTERERGTSNLTMRAT